MNQNRVVTIRCPLCDLEFQPLLTKTNICTNCLLQQTNVTADVYADSNLQFCRNCRRYNRPPWVLCERESKDLLTICLKKIRGLENKKLVDAKFIFTDESTKTVKIQLQIQQDVMNGTSVQESIQITLNEEFTQCDDCKREFTPHTWGASIQLRQRVEHKKTFLLLEQIILKHHMNTDLLKVEAVDEGMNFFYKQRPSALHMIDFLRQYLPIRMRASQEVYSFIKYTYVIDVPKVCKDDLIILPPKLAHQLGGIFRIQLCYKISSLIHLIDPLTLKTTEMTADKYFQYESDFTIFSLKDFGSEFTILDVERVKDKNLNESYVSSVTNTFIHQLCQVEVMKDDGLDYTQYHLTSHLGNILKPGHTFLGFDLSNQNNALDDIHNRPEIILVKKKVEKQAKKRKYNVKRMNIEEAGLLKKNKKNKEDNEEKQLEEFLDEIEQDEELRQQIQVTVIPE